MLQNRSLLTKVEVLSPKGDKTSICLKMFKLSSRLKAHKAVHEKKSVCLQHVSKDLFIEGYFEETY